MSTVFLRIMFVETILIFEQWICLKWPNRADLFPYLPKENFPISFKPKVAIAEFFWKMQRKTWYSILRLDAMPLSLKNLLLRKETIRGNAVCLMKNIVWHLVIYLRHFWSKMQIQDGELVNHQLVIGQPWYEVVE